MKYHILFLLIFMGFSCQEKRVPSQSKTLGNTLTKARTPEGQFISWKEHLIDDITISGADLSGSDGLEMADLDGDGYEDIVSVHESLDG